MAYALYLLMEGSDEVFSHTLGKKAFSPEKMTDWADNIYWKVMKTSPLDYYPSATVVAISDEPMTIALARPEGSNMAGHRIWSATPDKGIVDKLIEQHTKKQQS